MHATITHHFPSLFDWMREIDECRKKDSTYELAAHLTACLAMFLFKSGSRNQYNQKRKDHQFRDNYKKLFGFSMPHGDSVHRVIGLLDEQQIERLKQQMVKALLERKVFHPYRHDGKWHCIAIDGSGVVSFDHPHCPQCLHSTSKNGKTHYYHNVLDARLVTSNGFSLSIATVWIENPETEYDKQDCERKAFIRLAAEIKRVFPQLPILILADGLYPYEGFFGICEANRWGFICTFKEGNLKSVWNQVHEQGVHQLDNQEGQTYTTPDGKKIVQEYCWITPIDYQGYVLHWMECRETKVWKEPNDEGVVVEHTEESGFVHITNLPLNKRNIIHRSATGRLRWKIENEGFNTLKTAGYGMQHKWARKSYQALKNYYAFMQMAYLIHQLMIKTIAFQKEYLQESNHPTLKALWEKMLAAMEWVSLDMDKLKQIAQTRMQFRYIT